MAECSIITTNGIKAVRKYCSECGIKIWTGSNFFNFRIIFSDKEEKYTVCEMCRK